MPAKKLNDQMRRQVGAVIIARNEGERLRRSLQSVIYQLDHIVYVDSGSTDGSVEFARSMGVEIVKLDLTQPFTAGRARNAGVAQLLDIHPGVRFVQFIDGDCEIINGWLSAAYHAMRTQRDIAAVCGRRRERDLNHSVYNRLCELEWDTPIGEARSCGGDALMRIRALRDVDGFDPTVIAGEEPELCARLRQRHWRILRIDHDMTWHDASITHFGQWWTRCVRSGHAILEGAWRHGRSMQRYNVRRAASIVFWSAVLPVTLIATAVFVTIFALFGLLAYPLQMWRIYRGQRRRRRSRRDARDYAFFIMLGKFAECCGMFRFLREGRGTRRLIEYKSPVGT